MGNLETRIAHKLKKVIAKKIYTIEFFMCNWNFRSMHLLQINVFIHPQAKYKKI